jgi:hypothetical protein
MRKITGELAVDAGVTQDEGALFVEVNRDLIAERFAVGVLRTDVVQELHEIMKVAGHILAAE